MRVLVPSLSYLCIHLSMDVKLAVALRNPRVKAGPQDLEAPCSVWLL